MKVFLSHAQKDEDLAHNLAKRLSHGGFDVWSAEDQIAPGENWAKKIGKALEDSELMVILLTPGAIESSSLRRDVEFAIGDKKFADRVFSVYVGPTLEAGKDVPWILMRLPHMQVKSPRSMEAVAKEIRSQFNGSKVSHSHA